MRQVKRVVRGTRPGTRRRPTPIWAVRLRRVAAIVVGLGVVGLGADAIAHSAAVARVVGDLHRKLIAATADAGFVVTRVYSEGRSLADERTLAKTLEPYYGQPILSVDLAELKARVERVPWIRSASVGRRLPDTIWVRLDEHRPIARWLDGGHQVLVSDAHEVVRVDNAARFKQLPLLFGKGAPMRAEEVLALVAGEPDLAAHVTGARLVGERRWDIYLDGRIEVRLPAVRPEVAWRRLGAEQRASEVIARAITAVDLRNPDWLTLELPDTAIQPQAGPRA